MSQHKTIYCDFHGVITDGKIHEHENGTVTETRHSRDTEAVRELVRMGYEFIIVTACDSFERVRMINRFCSRTGIKKIQAKDKSTIPRDMPYIAIGDSSFDMPMFDRAVRRFCPADACQAILEYPDMHVLKTKGGEGVIDELLYILKQ